MGRPETLMMMRAVWFLLDWVEIRSRVIHQDFDLLAGLGSDTPLACVGFVSYVKDVSATFQRGYLL